VKEEHHIDNPVADSVSHGKSAKHEKQHAKDSDGENDGQAKGLSPH
jgi:hypothetical protein